jgi:prevent-host-death family protein
MSIRVSTTQLARHTREIVEQVRGGQTIVVQSHGKDHVVLLDVFDYRILNALAKLAILDQATLVNSSVEHILSQYSHERISLAKAAELLGISRYELMARFERLDIPIRIGPTSGDEAREEVLAALGE